MHSYKLHPLNLNNSNNNFTININSLYIHQYQLTYLIIVIYSQSMTIDMGKLWNNYEVIIVFCIYVYINGYRKIYFRLGGDI